MLKSNIGDIQQIRKLNKCIPDPTMGESFLDANSFSRYLNEL